jgi:hypothetical protein
MTEENKKILIVFDTNMLLQKPGTPKYYTEFNFGKFYFNLNKIICDNNIHLDKVELSITQMSIDEILERKKRTIQIVWDEFNNSFNKLKDKIYGNEILFSSELIKPDYNKDYLDTIISHFENFELIGLNIIPYPDSSFYEPTIQRAIKCIEPFMFVNANKKQGTDKGFKDVVIWDSMLKYFEENNFTHLLFLCDDGGFNKMCSAEFKEKFPTGTYFPTKDFKKLILEMAKNLPEIEKFHIYKFYLDFPFIVDKVIINDYEEELKSFILENTSKEFYGELKIVNVCEDIKEFEKKVFDNYFSDVEDLEFNDFKNTYIITSTIKDNVKEYIIITNFDKVANCNQLLLNEGEF